MVLRVWLPLFVALVGGFVHGERLHSTTAESYTSPTSPTTTYETDAPAFASTTQDFTSTITDSTTDTATTTSYFTETSTASETTKGTTEAPTSEATSATTEGPTTPPANVTTPSPTTEPTNATTISPTNATTVNPTNATTVIPTTPVPTTPPPNPSIGDYVVRADPKSPVCLKAKMGLQFRFKTGASIQTVNLDPNGTAVSGSCGSNGADATLSLNADQITVQFVFANQTNKFHLSGLNFTLNNGNESIFFASNLNLSLWEASLGSSYMCRKEQTFNVTDSLTLNTFGLQVQPFGVTEDKFSTAEECFLDADLSFLVPIAVGVALGFLIILVLISYLIGRRKSRTGYQSV